jgi:hypothetical protein
MMKKIKLITALTAILAVSISSNSIAAPTDLKPTPIVKETKTETAFFIKKPAKQTVKKMLSGLELKSVLIAAGFRGQDLVEAWGTAMKESTGRPFAHNKNSNTGDNSYGLFQINMIGSLGPARREQYKLKTNSDLFDPLTNAKIAYQMSNGGKDWSAWHGLTDRTKAFMAEFPR